MERYLREAVNAVAYFIFYCCVSYGIAEGIITRSLKGRLSYLTTWQFVGATRRNRERQFVALNIIGLFYSNIKSSMTKGI